MFSFAGQLFPPLLRGEWSDTASHTSGTMEITISSRNEQTITGTMMIVGSSFCKVPIQFTGTIVEQKAFIESTESVVCEYPGKLSGEVLHTEEGKFTGSFHYRWLGVAWAKGTFTLTHK